MTIASGNTSAAASIAGMENGVEIARAMQHADNLDSVRQRSARGRMSMRGIDHARLPLARAARLLAPSRLICLASQAVGGPLFSPS